LKTESLEAEVFFPLDKLSTTGKAYPWFPLPQSFPHLWLV